MKKLLRRVFPKKTSEFQLSCRALFSELCVLNGAFKGMKYPSLEAVGSSIYPKLLGSYERELSQVISYVIEQSYASIVDVGCAEGYYAVGLGMQCKGANIHAFDTDEHALDLCNQMAQLNGVNVRLGGFCDRDTLLGMDLGERALIISDCEGYERELFDSRLATSMQAHDFLIETHDFLDITITEKILSSFKKTHHCEIIESIDDTLKAYNYDYPILDQYTLAERRDILAEWRPQIMRWVFARSRSEGSSQEG